MINGQVEKQGNNRRDLLGSFFSGAGAWTCLLLKRSALTLPTPFFFPFNRQLMTLRHPELSLILLSERIREPDILWLCLHKFNIHRVAFSPTAVYELILAITADRVTSDDELLTMGSWTITLLETTNSEQKFTCQRFPLSISLCLCKQGEVTQATWKGGT